MLAVVASKYTHPSGYEIDDVDTPVVQEDKDVVIRVHAASVNPVDVKMASGVFKIVLAQRFPLRIGYDCAGIVEQVGRGVTRLEVGDEVWTRLPEISKGSWAELVLVAEDHVSLKPRTLSWEEAASFPLAGLTSMQALQQYDGSLAGKTVFVPAGLGGTGAYALQLAKRVFGAGTVITTVSTSKVDKVPQLLGPDVVDRVIDYTTDDPLRVIETGSVDFILDTMGQAMSYLSLLKPQTGTIVSISTTPSGTQMQNASFFKRPDEPRVPFYAHWILDLVDSYRKFRARQYSVKYTYLFLESDARSLDELRSHVEAGKVVPVVGSVISLRNIEGVRESCSQVYAGKGGVGKTVIKVTSDKSASDQAFWG